MPFIRFRHVISGSLAFACLARTRRTCSCALQPQRSPPRLLTDAACGGLEPLPAERLRRANLHLWHDWLLLGPIFYIDPSFSVRGTQSFPVLPIRWIEPED